MLPFLTAHDPLGASSGSIDPLGALQTYGALADMLLPGVTTITTRSRYLSMLCSALDNAEQHHRFLPGPSGLAQRRKAVEGFERLWALGCVAAREQGVALAADGLRGITYADKTYRKFAKHGKKVTLDFKLLKYQSRMGVTQHTVQVRWCGEGRIECEKDPDTGRWRIPGHEYDRLRRGGKPASA